MASMASMTPTTAILPSHRGTPNFSAAPTQNTAPVHEYRCLYTRDLHKKAKKWHDGSLRFHTFNSRVMVYDDTKNYIGDLHYRSDEAFGEGLELRLDRGVLVDVGDRLGETQTDLTGIVPEKPSPTASRPLPVPSARLYASQRPKSIMEVLGASQGRLGRARLPLQTPWETRNADSRPEPVVREPPPAKRVRLSPGRYNATSPGQGHAALPTLQPQKSRPLLPVPAFSTTRNTSKKPTKAQASHGGVVDISSDEEPRASVQKAQRPQLLSDKGARNPRPTKTGLHVPFPKATMAPPTSPLSSRKSGSKNTDTPTATKQKCPSLTGGATGPTTIARTKGTRSTEQPAARLLMNPPKPRPKLRCIQPLTPRMSEQISRVAPLDTSVEHGSPMTIGQSSRKSDTPPSQAALDVPDIPAPSEIVTIPSSQPELSLSSVLSGSKHESAHNPLFVSQDDPEPDAPSQRPVFSGGDFEIPEFEELDDIQIAAAEESPLFAGTSRSARRPESISRIAPTPPLVSLGCPNSPSADLGLLFDMSSPSPSPTESLERDNQEALLAKEMPLEAVAILSAESEPEDMHDFRGVLSETDAPSDDGEAHVLDIGNEKRNPLKVLENIASRRSPAKGKSPAKIQRCASDTRALELTAKPSVPQTAVSRSDTKGEPETGPWTSMEAFLLFDWWPPGKNKPNFGKLDEGVSVQPRASRPAAGYGGFTNARQVLRDEINVL